MTITSVIGKYKAPGRNWYQRNVKGITRFTVHHTASRATGTDDQVMRNEANHHINTNGWQGLSYHFFIPKNGNVYQVNIFADVTWHDGSNWDSLGIVLHGYFNSPYNEQPTEAQLRSLKELLDHLCTKHPEFPAAQSNVWGHGDRMSTACPGSNLFPKVTEYRTKAGNVSWGTTPAPIKFIGSNLILAVTEGPGSESEKLQKIRELCR